MMVEELFCALGEKLGDDLPWRMVPLTNETFVAELKREIGTDHFLYDQQIWAVAKCDANDDVLYLVGTDGGAYSYYLFHLTYSDHNATGYPKYKRFGDIQSVKEYLEACYE